jgi:toxin ParE1/3/4
MILLQRSAFFRDLDHCATYIAKDNPDAARRLIEAAESTCRMLLSQPEIGHQERFRKQHGIRSWRVRNFENYLIFYRINADSVEILRLLHGAQDLPRFFRSS